MEEEKNEIEEIDNTERGCGYLKENSIYLRAETSSLGNLPTFVRFTEPIPYLEQHYRGIKLINGLQFEIANPAKTVPPEEIIEHQDRLDSHETLPGKEINNFGSLISPFAFDILMWVGKEFYKTPEDYIEEAETMGVNKKIQLTTPPIIMSGFTKLYLIHPHACGKDKPGIIGYSYLTNVIYTKSSKDQIPEWVNDLKKLDKIKIVTIGKKKVQNQKSLGDVS